MSMNGAQVSAVCMCVCVCVCVFVCARARVRACVRVWVWIGGRMGGHACDILVACSSRQQKKIRATEADCSHLERKRHFCLLVRDAIDLGRAPRAKNFAKLVGIRASIVHILNPHA
jgi:hypothetical protein